jgi:hypothetical protein
MRGDGAPNGQSLRGSDRLWNHLRTGAEIDWGMPVSNKQGVSGSDDGMMECLGG